VKPGDLVRLVDGPNRSYGTFDQVGLVIVCYQTIRRGEHEPGYCVEVLFPKFTFKHPNFPLSMFEVVSEAG